MIGRARRALPQDRAPGRFEPAPSLQDALRELAPRMKDGALVGYVICVGPDYAPRVSGTWSVNEAAHHLSAHGCAELAPHLAFKLPLGFGWVVVLEVGLETSLIAIRTRGVVRTNAPGGDA